MALNGIFKSSLIMTKVFRFWTQTDENFVEDNLWTAEMIGFLPVHLFVLSVFPLKKVIAIILLVNTSNKSES